MPNKLICGSGYTLKYLGTPSGMLSEFYTPNHPVSCSSNGLGDGSIVGYVCRDSCALGDMIPNGTCTKAKQYGGVLNENEVLENIWNDCNQIVCSSGYKLQESNGSLQCVLASGR